MLLFYTVHLNKPNEIFNDPSIFLFLVLNVMLNMLVTVQNFSVIIQTLTTRNLRSGKYPKMSAKTICSTYLPILIY